jgi:hypothetical protein
MDRMAGCLSGVLVGIVMAAVHIVVRRATGVAALFGAVLLGAMLLLAAAAGLATVHRLYHLARGRRNRERGIPCLHCQRVAFPVEGTTARYRCWNCGSRFDGPEHFE